MRYVVTAEEMRALDRATIESLGLPGAVLMEVAGRRVVEVMNRDVLRGKERVAVVAGAGNNGGDGYVIARCLRAQGVDAIVYLAAREDAIRGDARLHLDVYRAMGGTVVSIAEPDALATHAAVIESADVIVDAVFGTGLARAVDGHYRAVIETMNRGRGRRVAVDIPSGLSADTGEILGAAVHAHCTVTMAFLKIGLASSPGFERAGTVHVAEIGIPESLAAQHGVRTFLMEGRDAARLMPRASASEHKNRRGHLLAVAGSPGKRGAARLTSWAALRTGAGLVTMASPWGTIEPDAPDPVMTARLEVDEDGATEALAALAADKQAVAMGPGMATSAGGRALVRHALERLAIPLVLDADALNHLGAELGPVAAARAPVIMTPHPGEAARLLGRSSADVQRDRLAAVRRLAAESRAVVVLKGARTLICDGTSTRDASALEVFINPTGNAGLATAGSGDVLTGVIASLAAQGLAAVDAARLGVYVHGRAGELASEALGERSVTSADLADYLPRALGEVRSTAS